MTALPKRTAPAVAPPAAAEAPPAGVASAAPAAEEPDLDDEPDGMY